MPPKKAPKKSPAKELYWPWLRNRNLEDSHLAWIAFAYLQFDYHGRNLDQEEVNGMIGNEFDLESFNLSEMFVKLDNPNDEYTIRAREMIKRHTHDDMVDKVKAILQRLYDSSEEARDRAANLSDT